VIVGSVADDFELTEVAFPELTDPRALSSALFTSYRGGVLGMHPYKEGGALSIRYTVQDGLAVPSDEDGMVLWSFAYYLTEIQQLVEAMGIDIEGLFPLRIAYAPDMSSDLYAYTNAAWVCGEWDHLFIVLPDFFTTYVPVGAHQGVIRHEFGHALFGHLFAGQSPTCPEMTGGASDSWALWDAADEGFADILAALTLDDPAFMMAALPVDDRDLRLEQHVASTDLYVQSITEQDPYIVGSVLAAFAWDIREDVGTEAPLAATLTATMSLREQVGDTDEDEFVMVPDQLALGIVSALSDDSAALASACDALAFRFPHLETPLCSS